uniref:ATP-grasp domain-containing protein n=1 Tax=Nocardia jejuensis TaxID=328049 RepID=UPI000831E5BC
MTVCTGVGTTATHTGTMRVGLLTSNPDHPVLAAAAVLLSDQGHRVETLAPDAECPADPADVYLLKARTPAAIELARSLQDRGITVLNSAAATEFCQDRLRMARLADDAGLPFAVTTGWPDLRSVPAHLDGPLVIKSRRSRRNDLVARVTGRDQLHALAAEWPDEPVVVQDFTPGTGWDHKLWVIGGEVFAALRHSELTTGPRQADRQLPGAHPWADLALVTGEVFGLDIYGVDLLEVDGEPLIIDVNAFPGVRGPEGAARAL